MTENGGWWACFGRIIAVAAGWHVIPLLGGLAGLIAIVRYQSHQCVDCHAFDALIFIGILLMLAASAVISLILAAVIANFRPRYPLRWGNLAGLTGVIETGLVLYFLVGLAMSA